MTVVGEIGLSKSRYLDLLEAEHRLEEIKQILAKEKDYWTYTPRLDHLFDRERFIKDLRAAAGDKE